MSEQDHASLLKPAAPAQQLRSAAGSLTRSTQLNSHTITGQHASRANCTPAHDSDHHQRKTGNPLPFPNTESRRNQLAAGSPALTASRLLLAPYNYCLRLMANQKMSM